MQHLAQHKRLTFMWRILLLPSSDISKHILLCQIYKYVNKSSALAPQSPVYLMLKSLIKYGLLSQVTEAIKTGVYCLIAQWKRTLPEKLSKNQRDNNQVAQLHTYRKLKMFTIIQLSCQNTWPWWQFADHHPERSRECRTIIRLLSGGTLSAIQYIKVL